MSSVREYLKKMDPARVADLLRQYCEGDSKLYPDIALTICDVLSENDPGKPDVYEAFRCFCAQFLPD